MKCEAYRPRKCDQCSPKGRKDRTLSVLRDSKPQQQNNDAKDMRHVSSQAEYIHTHDGSQTASTIHKLPQQTQSDG
jgi:hypothetical protein